MSAIRVMIWSAILTVTATGLFASSYYVTQSGAGSGNGSSLANAWSVANYNTTSAPTGGDTVYFSGTIASTVTPKTSGTGNGTGRLTLDFSAARLTSPAITLSSVAYLTLLGGPIVDGTDNSILINCAYVSPGVGHDITISNFTTAASGIPGGNDTFFSIGSCTNVTISNNTIDHVLSFVNEWQGKTHDITILNNYARTSGSVTQQSDLINLGDTINVVIQGNLLESNSPGSQSNGRHNDIIQTYQGGDANNQIPSSWTIAYNFIEEDVTDCADTDGSNSWTMLENMGGTNYIYGNVFYAPGPCYFGNGMTTDSDQSSVTLYVYNNTYLSPNGYPPIVAFDNSGTLYFRNNSFEVASGNGTYLTFQFTKGALWDYNYGYNVPGCGSTVTGSHGSCTKNPLFTNFSGGVASLQSGSPLIGAGDSTIGSTFNQGITPGATWPNPALSGRGSGSWDVGAFQTANVSSVPPNPPSQLTATAY